MGHAAKLIYLFLILIPVQPVFTIETEGDGYQLRLNVEKNFSLNQKHFFDNSQYGSEGFGRRESFSLRLEGKLENNLDIYGKIDQQSGVDDPLQLNLMARKEGWSIEIGRFSSRINSGGIFLNNRTIDGAELSYSDSVWNGNLTVSSSQNRLTSFVHVFSGENEVSLPDSPVNKENFVAELDGKPLVEGRDYILDHRRGVLRFTSKFIAERNITGTREKARLRIVYEINSGAGEFQAARIHYKPVPAFMLALGTLNSSEYKAGEGTIAFSYDSLFRFESQGVVELPVDSGRTRLSGAAKILLNAGNRIDGYITANYLDSGVSSSSVSNFTEPGERYKAALKVDSISGVNLDGEFEMENRRKFAAVKLNYSRFGLFSAAAFGNLEKSDSIISLFAHLDGGMHTKRVGLSGGIEYGTNSENNKERLDYFAKVNTGTESPVSAALRLTAGMNRYTINCFVDGRGKYGDANIAATTDIDTAGKVGALIDWRGSISGGKLVDADINLRGTSSNSVWNSFLCRSNMQLNPVKNLSLTYSPTIHSKYSSEIDSTSFEELEHDGRVDINMSKLRNSSVLKISSRKVHSVREEWNGEKSMLSELTFLPSGVMNIRAGISVAFLQNGEKNPECRQKSREEKTAQIRALVMLPVGGEIECAGSIGFVQQDLNVGEIAAIDSLAIFTPQVDTFSQQYYFANTTERRGNLVWRKSGKVLSGIVSVKFIWDSDYKSPSGTEIGSCETWGLAPEIGLDVYKGTLFTLGAKGGGDWLNGYKKGTRLNSALDAAFSHKYFRISTSLYWENERRELGTVQSLEWRIDAGLKL